MLLLVLPVARSAQLLSHMAGHMILCHVVLPVGWFGVPVPCTFLFFVSCIVVFCVQTSSCTWHVWTICMCIVHWKKHLILHQLPSSYYKHHWHALRNLIALYCGPCVKAKLKKTVSMTCSVFGSVLKENWLCNIWHALLIASASVVWYSAQRNKNFKPLHLSYLDLSMLEPKG